MAHISTTLVVYAPQSGAYKLVMGKFRHHSVMTETQ